MKKEECYNIFIVYKYNIIVKIGIVADYYYGDDNSKLKELRKRVIQDFENCKCFLTLSYEEMIELNSIRPLGFKKVDIMIYDLLEKNGIGKYPANPLYFATPIHNGEINYKLSVHF